MRTRFLLVISLLFASTLAVGQGSSITPKEIQETWVGKTLVGTTANGAGATMCLGADGAAQVAAGGTRDTGTWRLSEEGYCTTWKKIRVGEERCFTVRRSGSNMEVLNSDGSH
jgi:hypothetical protein